MGPAFRQWRSSVSQGGAQARGASDVLAGVASLCRRSYRTVNSRGPTYRKWHQAIQLLLLAVRLFCPAWDHPPRSPPCTELAPSRCGLIWPHPGCVTAQAELCVMACGRRVALYPRAVCMGLSYMLSAVQTCMPNARR